MIGKDEGKYMFFGGIMGAIFPTDTKAKIAGAIIGALIGYGFYHLTS